MDHEKTLAVQQRKAQSCTWTELTQHRRKLDLCWLTWKGAGSPGEQWVKHISSVPCGNNGSSAHWAVTGKEKPRGQRKGLFSSPWWSRDFVRNIVSSTGSPGTRETLIRGGVQNNTIKMLKGLKQEAIKWGWENWLCWAWGWKGSEVLLLFSVTYRMVIEMMGLTLPETE